MMANEKYKNYLIDLGSLTAEYAREAIQEKKAAEGTASLDYETGYVMGIHRSITLMKQQAELFDIPLEELCLENIEESEFFEN